MKSTLVLFVAFATLATMSAQAADAKESWDKTCAKCHGADGKGDTKMGKKLELKDLSDPKIQAALTDDKAFKVIKEGVKDGDKTKMKPAEGLSDADIKGLVAYVRKLKK